MSERYTDHKRARSITVSFRLSPEECRQMMARIAITGLPKADFMIRSMLDQSIVLRVGKFESDRLGVEIGRLKARLERAETPENAVNLLLECRALMEQIIKITNTQVRKENENG